MKPAPFWYHRPASREEVDEVLARVGGDVRILAGGQSLVPMLAARSLSPAHVIDVNFLRGEADEPVPVDDGVAVGPTVRQAAVEAWAPGARSLPLLAEALPWVANPVVRARGTVVGSVAHADPAAEIPAVLVLLGGRVRVRRLGATRWVPAAEFLVGPHETDLAPDEWVDEVLFPVAPVGTGWAVEEFARRRGDRAVCGVAAGAAAGDGGTIRITLVPFAPGSRRRAEALEPLLPAELAGAALEEAVTAILVDALDPVDDVHATARYRARLALRLGIRAARRAAARVESA